MLLVLMSYNDISLKESGQGCQGPIPLGSYRLVKEAVSLGCVVRSVSPQLSLSSPFELEPLACAGRRSLPPGHRFYQDCLREQEARLIEWLIRLFPGDCWFFTQTFRDWLCEGRAERLRTRFLGRLDQAYRDISGAALLKSISSVEWQQRDVIHFHLLILGIGLGSLSRKRWEFRWRMISGGFAADYDAELKAAPYLAKHQIKDHPDGSLHFGGSWRGIVPPRSVGDCCSLSEGLQRFGFSSLPGQ